VSVLAFALALAVPSAVFAATTAPTATTGAASSITTASAVLHATVNPNGSTTTYAFQYGTTTNYGSQTSTTAAGSGTKDVAAHVTISSLVSGTTYHYRVVATNPNGTAAGADAMFVSTSNAPVVVLGTPSLVTANAATLTGSVNPNHKATTYTFQYGTTAGYGLQSAPVSVGSGQASKSVSTTLTGLASGTTYYYRLVAVSADGTGVSAGRTLVTTGTAVSPTGPAPVVSQAAAVMITSSSVQLNGAINPEGDNTTWYFEYGLTSNYGLETTPGTLLGLGIRPVNAPITGLQAGTTYYFRLVANSANGLYVGPDQTFTTKSATRPYARAFTLTTTHYRGRYGLHITVSGRLVRPSGISAATGCTGVVTIRFERSNPYGPTFLSLHTSIHSDCTYKLTTWFAFGHLQGHKHFGVTARFGGNSALQPSMKRLTVYIA
jgi:hypothetical protein